VAGVVHPKEGDLPVPVIRRFPVRPPCSGPSWGSPRSPQAPPNPRVAPDRRRARRGQERLDFAATQDHQKCWVTWRVDYRIRNDGPTALVVAPADIAAEVDGWVSNSRVASHALPRRSSLALAGPSALSATADVLASADETRCCRERATLQVWPGETAAAGPAAAADAPPMTVAPGATVRVRLLLEHQHFLFGPFDPLLGSRTLVLHLGPASLRDTLPLDRELSVAQASSTWRTPPTDRVDSRQFVSPPDSLHLEAHVPGNRIYHFPEQPVRYGTRMRLRFWYLIAPGTEDQCRARIAQFRDAPHSYKSLSDGAVEECLPIVGRWVHVERIFRTEPEATTLRLDFRILGDADVGECWIDDVALEPIDADPEGP
jgi:hypothetical protein